ncbi:MAG: hypothetical protein M3Q71_20655 [Chloroflexota bacterium]|nr:hypothetical protein [Chloroflexota bacterium]MDP9473040.1 hypothetical protein [Chloroflexota bacterium]
MATEIRDGIYPSSAPAHRVLTPELLDTDREAVYQRWAYVDGQNAAETARALGLSPRTVQDWAQREGWRHRLDAERKEQTARVWSVAELALLRAVPRVIERLERIALGQGDVKPQLTKDGELVEVEIPIPYQAQVNAANSLLDRFGLSSVQLHQHQLAPAPTAPTTPASTGHDTTATPTTPLTREAAMAMTPEQRQQWELARRRRQQAD